MISKAHFGSWTCAFDTITISMLLCMRTASASLHPLVWTSFKVQRRNCSCPGRQFVYKMSTHLIRPNTYTRLAETPCEDWRLSWQTAILLLPCTLVRPVAFGYTYVLRSDLRAPNFKNWSGGACRIMCTHHHWCPPPLPEPSATTYCSSECVH